MEKKKIRLYQSRVGVQIPQHHLSPRQILRFPIKTKMQNVNTKIPATLHQDFSIIQCHLASATIKNHHS